MEPFSKPEKIHLQFWLEEPSHLLFSLTNKITKLCDFLITAFIGLHVCIYVLPPRQLPKLKGLLRTIGQLDQALLEVTLITSRFLRQTFLPFGDVLSRFQCKNIYWYEDSWSGRTSLV